MDVEEASVHVDHEPENNDLPNHEHHESAGDGYEDTVPLVDGIQISKKTLRLVAGGAMGALFALGLGKGFRAVRPAAVCTIREGYAFKEWLAAKFERLKEDVEDVVAEAVFSYHADLAATADAIKREKELLEKIEKIVEERSAKARAEIRE